MKKNVFLMLLIFFSLVSCVTDNPYSEKKEPVVVDNSLKGKLVLNEINGVGKDKDKYIELYNLSDKSIELKGVSIYYNSVDSDPKVSWVGTDETIHAKGFLLLKGTKKKSNPEHALITGLSGSQGINIEIRDSENKTVDFFKIDAQEGRKKSFARIPNGTGSWFLDTSEGTPGYTNGDDTVGKTPIVL